mgnify:CR=1 FL=1
MRSPRGTGGAADPDCRRPPVGGMTGGFAFVLDTENRIVDLNPAAQRIIDRQDDVIGQPADANSLINVVFVVK